MHESEAVLEPENNHPEEGDPRSLNGLFLGVLGKDGLQALYEHATEQLHVGRVRPVPEMAPPQVAQELLHRVVSLDRVLLDL